MINTERAINWGRWLAHHLSRQGTNNPFLLAIKFGWRVILENDTGAGPLMPIRLAEWDGSRRLISLFIPVLQRYIGNANSVLYRACAHELFHGLAAVNYRGLRLPVMNIPRFNCREEEIAAQVFSATLLHSQPEEELCRPLVSH